MKTSTVAIVGRPSSGKSTLLNAILKEKVSLVSPTPQATRNNVRGIYTEERGQLVFIDTPGFHLSEKEINKKMIRKTKEALKEADIIIHLVDGSRERGEEEEKIEKLVSLFPCPSLCVVNKKDILNTNRSFPPSSLFISAKKEEGLDDLLSSLFALSFEGEAMYDAEEKTSMSTEFRISEIIREKAISGLYDELPHAVYVEILDMEERDSSLWVRAVIFTERDGQKGFLVGKGGENIKRIRREAEKDIKSILPYSSCKLDLRVKSDKNWRKKEKSLSKIFRF